METDLTGRVALITGASLGLGRAMAKSLYQHGARVALLARRAEPLAAAQASITTESAAEGIAHAGGELASFVCDVANAEQLAKAHNDCVERFGAVDILINNAGKASAKPFTHTTEADWQEDIDLKLMAAVRLCQLVWPDMQKRKRGRIINLLNTMAKAPSALSLIHI